MKQNIIKDKTYSFSIDTIRLVREFPKSTDAFIIAKQLLRSATSIGANAEEAISGFTKKDFIHKMSIALKECVETKYWLSLTKDTDILNISKTDKLLKEA